MLSRAVPQELVCQAECGGMCARLPAGRDRARWPVGGWCPTRGAHCLPMHHAFHATAVPLPRGPPRCVQMSERDAAERIFVGGLPYYLTEEQCRELLGSFGAIKSFDLIKDRETQQSKGWVQARARPCACASSCPPVPPPSPHTRAHVPAPTAARAQIDTHSLGPPSALCLAQLRLCGVRGPARHRRGLRRPQRHAGAPSCPATCSLPAAGGVITPPPLCTTTGGATHLCRYSPARPWLPDPS